MLRRRAAQALVLLHQQQQAAVQQCLIQVAALHAGRLAVPTGAASEQPRQPAVIQTGVQQPQVWDWISRSSHRDYHAPASDPHQGGQQQDQQHYEQHRQVIQRAAREPRHEVDRQHAHEQSYHSAVQHEAAGACGTTPGSFLTSSSSPHTMQGNGSSVAASSPAAAVTPAADEHLHSDDVFLLSSPEEQYRHTLAALHVGNSRNLDQLAYMFDPHAVLAAPDRGAAILEALMFAAAKLQDLQMLRQLLRCTAAAGNALSSRGHRAILQCLASCDRPAEALQWLQVRVPEEQVTPQLLRSLVHSLLRLNHVQAAQHAMDYAEPKLLQRLHQGLQQPPAAGDGTEGPAASAGAVQLAPGPSLSAQDMQEVLSLRLLISGSKGVLSDVQQAWGAVEQQARELQQLLRGQSGPGAGSDISGSRGQLQHGSQLLGVSVRAGYVLALSKAVQQRRRRPDPNGEHLNPEQSVGLLQDEMLQLLDAYHASVWHNYLQRQAAAVGLQQQQQGEQEAGVLPELHNEAVAAGQRLQQDWLSGQYRAAQQLWQQHRQRGAQLSWLQLHAAVLVPQQVASAAHTIERQLCSQALDAVLVVAAANRNEQAAQQLLQLASLLKLMPRERAFEALLQLKLKQGAPPEALEELLGEMMGWGIIPSVAAYEHVMEAHALHGDMDAAEGMLDRMQAAGHHPVLRTYNRLLHGAAMNGSLSMAIRVYNRLKLQHVQPDMQTMRSLFKCVRLYASQVRVATARTIFLSKSGDREAIFTLLSQRAALFASAYSQLALWQRDMAAAGMKHTAPSMTHLSAALERLGALDDCLQLAKLAEDARPGEYAAHRAALQVAGRVRDVRHAGEASRLAARLAEGDAGLSKSDYLALINSQFWLNQDHEQLLQSVAAMKAAGHELNEQVLQQLLHVYCHNGMWGEALQVLDDFAAGRFETGSRSSTSRGSTRGTKQQQQSLSTGVRRQAQGSSADGAAAAAAADRTMGNDKLWHVVMRKLWETRASDALLNEFLQHMGPKQLQRFKLLYGLQAIPGQPGMFTLQPQEDWQKPLQLQSQMDQEQRQQDQQEDEGEEAGAQQQQQLSSSSGSQQQQLSSTVQQQQQQQWDQQWDQQRVFQDNFIGPAAVAS